eukprot:CAMPEP_0194259496 /NCGR_PEP_ID=MMETSP0158-20130606/43728_1 /TAXON_ID=33649 /ORGANISM="Thalassionema nitzschioides, Strain L26-B" /LENGTH=140 /DNA_ID=CAMNT_0038999315 /DNA_START=74 /DNA_END=493 /DNA_ORIENTATION=+
MPPSSKRKRQSRTAAATSQRYRRSLNVWTEKEGEFTALCDIIRNPKGRTRGIEENKLLLLALRAGMKRRIAAATETRSLATQITWTDIEQEVAEDFGVGKKCLAQLRQTFLEDGDVEDNLATVAYFSDNSDRGRGSPAYP